MNAVLSNAEHPEYGQATIPVPIPREEYDHVIELLAALEIGSPVDRDCKVDELIGAYPIYKCLEGQQVNLDELDYLMKLTDRFFSGEEAQYQGMAHKQGLTSITDLINLHFCCQQVTVITDFSDLAAIGRDHYLNINGGSVPTKEMENLDCVETAYLLICDQPATVTPYGVVYDNGMKLKQLYKGKEFPEYHYEPCVMTVAMTTIHKADCPENTTWLFLPAAEQQIHRAMARAGIDSEDHARFRFSESSLPEEVDVLLDFERESIFELNRLCQGLKPLAPKDLEKLGAAVQMAAPVNAHQVRQLAENLELFDFVPRIRTAEEYGKYLIQESGHFDFDENLEGYYNYERYGQDQMGSESGEFNDRGYIAYRGALSLDELMMEAPSEQGFRMGGLCR